MINGGPFSLFMAALSFIGVMFSPAYGQTIWGNSTSDCVLNNSRCSLIFMEFSRDPPKPKAWNFLQADWIGFQKALLKNQEVFWTPELGPKLDRFLQLGDSLLVSDSHADLVLKPSSSKKEFGDLMLYLSSGLSEKSSGSRPIKKSLSRLRDVWLLELRDSYGPVSLGELAAK